jgi:hypothetical protein
MLNKATVAPTSIVTVVGVHFGDRLELVGFNQKEQLVACKIGGGSYWSGMLGMQYNPARYVVWRCANMTIVNNELVAFEYNSANILDWYVNGKRRESEKEHERRVRAKD